MKISTKGIYAIEAMVDLALHSKDGVESLKNIAERRSISDKYLEQIIGALRKEGLVVSIRGAGGGYRLSKPSNEINILEILQAVESNLVPMECLYQKTDCGINSDTCATKQFWGNLWNEMSTVINQVTLKDLVQESEKFQQEEAIEYYI